MRQTPRGLSGTLRVVSKHRGDSEVLQVSDNDRKLSFIQVLGSVMSSFLGVQKNETRERDFTRGRARYFIMVGVLLTLLFILAVWGVVQLVMRVAVPG